MKALIVEDDKILAKTVEQCLGANFDFDHAYDGEEGILYAEQSIYDIIILDLMMPVMDGYQMLALLRQKKINTPVLILTAKDGIEDKVKGFRAGADDYLVKPFNREELIARVEAIIRRSRGNIYSNQIEFKDMVLDLSSRRVRVGDEELLLQGKQFDVLEYLISAKNSIITKEQIFDKIWGFDSETTTNVIEVYVSGLRKELKRVGYDIYFKTIRGVGYMWSE
jgi:two-component system response regulator CiaR